LAIDASTGSLTPVTGSPFATGITPAGITISPNGSFLYVANQSTNNVSAFAIVAGTGALTPVGPPVPAGTTPTSVTVSPDGAFLYAANQGSNDVFAYRINSASGSLATVSGSPFTVGVTPRAIATAGHP
jgi:3-carboxymuconate cyclase